MDIDANTDTNTDAPEEKETPRKKEKPEEPKRFFIRLPLDFNSKWEKMISNEKKTKSKTKRNKNYEYGFTRAVKDLKYKGTDFVASYKFCISLWGKAEFLTAIYKSGCGRKMSASKMNVKKVHLVSLMHKIWCDHGKPTSGKFTASKDPATTPASKTPAAKTPAAKTATTNPNPDRLGVNQVKGQLILLADIVSLYRNKKRSFDELYEMPTVKNLHKNLLQTSVNRKLLSNFKTVRSFMRAMNKVFVMETFVLIHDSVGIASGWRRDSVGIASG